MLECTKYKEVNKGSLKGFAHLFDSSTGLEIYGCGVFTGDNGKRWMSMPQKEYKDAEGNTKYVSVLKFRDRQQQDAFSRAALTAIDRHIQEVGNSNQKTPKTFSEMYESAPCAKPKETRAMQGDTFDCPF